MAESAMPETTMPETKWDAATYRERALGAQERAAGAPSPGLAALWLELAERYFELADQVEQPDALRFPHKLHASPGGRALL
jgi:hypothetical protein